MKNKNQNQITEDIIEDIYPEEEIISEPVIKKDYSFHITILISSIVLAGAWIYTTELKNGTQQETNIVSNQESVSLSGLDEKVLPSEGVMLPVSWGDLGKQLVINGTIDAEKFKEIYESRGQFTDEYNSLLFEKNNGKIKITNENSGYLLNLFWALGLASKNPILDKGEMTNPKYGGAENFASTGGWTLAKGNTMDHYSRHEFFNLTSEQQALVDKVSKGIYRPCCGNSTNFPDCNHGMAMLGLLELMASQGASEQDMWKTALTVNSYWFPDTYLTIATYMKDKGTDWKDINPQEVLGINYSSSKGYRNIASQVTQPQQQGGGSGCGV